MCDQEVERCDCVDEETKTDFYQQAYNYNKQLWACVSVAKSNRKFAVLMSALRQFAAGPPTLLSATCSLHPQDDVVRCRKKVMGVDDDADEVSLGTS